MKNKAPQEVERILEAELASISSGERSLEDVLREHAELAVELRPRLEAALWLKRRAEALTPRAGYIHASRLRLQEQIGFPSAEQSNPQRRKVTPRLMLQYALMGLLAFVVLTVGNLARLSSRSALPGDPFYLLKQAIEQVNLALTTNRLGEARLYVEYAQRRSAEIDSLIFEERYEYIPATTADLERKVTRARALMASSRDGAQIEALKAELAETLALQNLVLGALVNSLPANARPGIEQAMHVASE